MQSLFLINTWNAALSSKYSANFLPSAHLLPTNQSGRNATYSEKKKNDAVVIVMEKKLEKTSFAIQRKRESSSKAKKKILQLLLKVKKEAVGEL